MFIVDEEHSNQRVDKIISEILNISRNIIQNSKILVNEKEVKPSYKLKIKDVVDIIIEEKEDFNLEAVKGNLDILYEDEYLAIIYKPYNMVIHPSDSFKGVTLVNLLKYNFKNLSDIDPIRSGIVHRLDKDTSGALIITKTNEAHQKLMEMFKNHKIKKTYLAILKGKLNKEEIKIENYIGRDKKNRQKISTNTTSGRLAISNFKVIAKNERYTFVSVNILTGRTHQIRVHAKELGCPILGDSLYGRESKVKRQQLHAYMLEFIHPFTNEKICIKCGIPNDMKENLCKIGFDNYARIY